MQNRLQTANTARMACQRQSAFYSQCCRFPGCERAAPHGARGDEEALCLEHEQLRFYRPAEFDRLWASDPGRVPPR